MKGVITVHFLKNSNTVEIKCTIHPKFMNLKQEKFGVHFKTKRKTRDMFCEVYRKLILLFRHLDELTQKISFFMVIFSNRMSDSDIDLGIVNFVMNLFPEHHI